MLEIKDLVVTYGGITALQGISLSIPDGKIVSMVGANGAGKSTTINAISGMVKKSSGLIHFDGISLDLPPQKIVRLGVVQVPEGRKIFSAISVKENIILGAYTIRDKTRIETGLERVYKLFPILEKRKNQPGGTLSGGEQQMLAIARALMAEPKILLLDEPSLGLAPKLILDIFRLIEELHEKGLTILLVEQNARKALSISDYAYVLETGRIIAQGTGEEMSENPIVRKAYLGCLD
ncbi:MAG TPA: ABC transporter ATP-binding protein [Spirochaetales bacterium]|nr:ABC transporter ATP-binding protein [Spirochaetales bacterium]